LHRLGGFGRDAQTDGRDAGSGNKGARQNVPQHGAAIDCSRWTPLRFYWFQNLAIPTFRAKSLSAA
jgi:hypothetical protein